MLKVSFKELKAVPEMKSEFYNSISRIPFSLKIVYSPITSAPIYARNLSDGNFIEFRFDKINKNLYEIVLVSVQTDTIQEVEEIKFNCRDQKFYSCFIHEEHSRLEDSIVMKIFQDKKSICINWNTKNEADIEYFALTNNYLIGINPDSYLVSIILTNLLSEDILNVLGL